ncbi:Ejaculatory bulb-specific protein 3 [Blattella germanica]|nr:Ejaculatory bulb-specific protein 3 [Blattella germanica]
MMKYWALFVVLVTLALSWAAEDKYSSRYDHIDVDAILRNDRALNRDLPDALQTDCEKCTEKQKELVRKAAKYLVKERPQHWQRIVKKYDPDRQYSERFQRFLNQN